MAARHLDREQVDSIRQVWIREMRRRQTALWVANPLVTQKDLAEQYHVSIRAISEIVNGKTYKMFGQPRGWGNKYTSQRITITCKDCDSNMYELRGAMVCSKCSYMG